MTDQAAFQIRETEQAVVIEVAGEIDILNATDFRAMLENAVTDHAGPVVLCLTAATYFDSQTLEILANLSKRISLLRRRMLLVAPRPGTARRLLDISGISTAIQTCDTVEEALGAVTPTRG